LTGGRRAEAFREKISEEKNDNYGKYGGYYSVTLAQEISPEQYRQIKNIKKSSLIDNKEIYKAGKRDKKQDVDELFIDIDFIFKDLPVHKEAPDHLHAVKLNNRFSNMF